MSLEQANKEFIKIVRSNNPIIAAKKLLPYHLDPLRVYLAGIKSSDVINFIKSNYDEAESEYKYWTNLKEPYLDWLDRLIYRRSRHEEILKKKKRERVEIIKKKEKLYLYWSTLVEEFINRKKMYENAVEEDRAKYYRPVAEFRDRTGGCMRMPSYEERFSSFVFVEDEYGRVKDVMKETLHTAQSKPKAESKGFTLSEQHKKELQAEATRRMNALRETAKKITANDNIVCYGDIVELCDFDFSEEDKQRLKLSKWIEINNIIYINLSHIHGEDDLEIVYNEVIEYKKNKLI